MSQKDDPQFAVTQASKSSYLEEILSTQSAPSSLLETPSECETESRKPLVNFAMIDSLFSLDKSEGFGAEDVPRFTKSIIVCTLTECLNELAMLRSINLQNDLGTNPNKLPTYVSIDDRYMGQENHAEHRINAANSNFDKLAKDINMLYVVLSETCKEILKSGRYSCLEELVENVTLMHKDEEMLLENEANHHQIIDDLKNWCEQERLDNIRTIEETDAKIQTLRFQAEDIYIYGKLEVEFFEKWEKTRTEQNMMKCVVKEDHYKSVIEGTDEKMAIEKRCHSELEKYFDEIRNDYLEEIQQWMRKYDEETDQREGDILTLKSDLERITEEKQVVTEKYEKLRTEIKDWLEYKRVKEEKEKQRQKEIDAAVTIQSWWRGVMVRKKLGPYKKKKKGKKGAKDKKTKKEKK